MTQVDRPMCKESRVVLVTRESRKYFTRYFLANTGSYSTTKRLQHIVAAK